MTSALIRAMIAENLPNAEIFISDADYAKPTAAWITGDFYNYYLNWLEENGLSKWKETFDCDSFSSLFYAFAQACHGNAGRKEQGIAVGEMFYKVDGGSGHAINIAITEKGIIFIEPQNGQRVMLSVSEMTSCWFVRF